MSGDDNLRQVSPADVIGALIAANLTVATAESLTGGLLAAALTSVAGSSACMRGGIVSYATDLKSALLGVDVDLLARCGPVDAEVARQMASGVAAACGSAVGISTPGVAGPSEQKRIAVGTVFVAVISPRQRFGVVRELALPGDRRAVRDQTVAVALEVLLAAV